MLKTSLQLRLGQQLTMTPQLQQAIRLLQLPIIELQSQIQDALDENLMLEAVEEPGEAPINEEPINEEPINEEPPAVEANWNDTAVVTGPDNPWAAGEGRSNVEYADQSGETLTEHLAWQLGLGSFSSEAAAIGRTIIDYTNEDGYLTVPLESIQQVLRPDVEASLEEIEAVLWELQQFDPAGVCARSLSECLDLQLRQLDRTTAGLDLARRIAKDYLELVAQHQFAALRRRLSASEEQLDQAVAIVRSLHPRPGSAIQASTAEYVIPDVFVRKLDGRWLVEINGHVAPRLRVNQNYAGLITRTGDHSALKAQLQEARWLVRSLEIRNETLLKVAACIVERQHAFLERGDEAMQPLVLREVAEALEMHESTISRVTTNKYMHTPRGVFEFRHFFSSHVLSKDGSGCSSTAIRARIRKLIAHEDPRKPLSDSKIAAALKSAGIDVARRTIAKYREAMSIPSSSERKRLTPR